MIPLISSICYGPSGWCQLPRLWWKVTLEASGVLDDDYPECSGGLDRQVLEKMGLDQDETLAYIHSERPDYLTFEAWAGDRSETREGDMEEWNTHIRGRLHRQEKIDDIYATLGFGEGEDLTSAVVLNQLEDWHFFYSRDLESDALQPFGGQVIPLISTLDYGPLGACQLPRTWYKVVLETRGLLHGEYPACGGGLDARVLSAIGLDRDATVAHLEQEQPSYLAFEAWVREALGGEPDAQGVADWNAFVRERVHNEDKRQDIHRTLGREDDGSITSAVVQNHLEDWHLAHSAVVS